MKTPNKLYIVKDKKGKLSKAYKRLHDAKNKMGNDSDMLITYTVESEETLKSMKRGARLSRILGNFPNELEKNVISILRKYVISDRLKKLHNITSTDELKKIVIGNKRTLISNMETLSEFKIILNFHNFRSHGVGISDEKKSMFNITKEFNKSK